MWPQLKAGPNNMTVLTVYTVHIRVYPSEFSTFTECCTYLTKVESSTSVQSLYIISLPHSICLNINELNT